MAGETPIPDLPKWTWLGGDGRLARRVGKPIRRFLHVEAAGGVILLIAAAIALIWANSPWSQSYYDLWHTDFELVIGCLLYTSPSPRDQRGSRMPSSA